MAKDVEAELVAVVRRESGRSEEAALEYVKALKDAKRYRKDVY
jgi:sulfite reductase alpha subunit-like flavoprotein